MALKIKEIKNQADFCLDLMRRVWADLYNDEDEDAWSGMRNHTQKRSDIIRLRRELNKLNQLLDPWGNK